MSKCPVCETENAPGVLICEFCGTELPEEKAAPEATETAANENSAPAAAPAPASAPASDSFFDNPNYGIIAIVCTIFLGWIGLVMAILGMTKSTNEDVRKKCKIAVILGIVLVVISVVFSIIYGVVVGAAASSGAIDPSAMPVYGSCLGGY